MSSVDEGCSSDFEEDVEEAEEAEEEGEERRDMRVGENWIH